MNRFTTCTDWSDFYRDSAAIEIARLDTAAVPGNLADVMKNAIIRIPYDYYPLLPVVPTSKQIPISEDAQKRAKNENVDTD